MIRRQNPFLTVVVATMGFVTFGLASTRTARAQEVNLSSLEDERSDRVFTRTGAEHGFVAALGYAKTLRMLGRASLVSGEVTAPWAGFDGSDFRLCLGVLTPIARGGRWKLAAGFFPTLRRTGNELGRMTSVGADVGVTGGYYARHWFVAGEAGFDWSMTTHVSHSDGYRNLVFDEARNGWYANPGGNIRYGLQAGTSFSRYDIVLRIGQMRDTAGQPPLLPFYGTLALVTRW